MLLLEGLDLLDLLGQAGSEGLLEGLMEGRMSADVLVGAELPGDAIEAQGGRE